MSPQYENGTRGWGSRRAGADDGVRLLGRGVDLTLNPAPATETLDTLLDGDPHRVGDLPGDHALDLVRRLVLATVLVTA